MKTISKRKVGTFFQYYGVLMLIVTVVSYTAMYSLFSRTHKVQKEEQINFFSTIYGVENNFKIELLNYLKDKDDDKLIYEVNVYNYEPDSPSLIKYYEAFGLKADFLILKGNDLEDMKEAIEKSFYPFNDFDVLNTLALNYYQFNGLNYGILLHDENISLLSNYFNYGEKNDSYYLLVNKNTINLKRLNGKTDNVLHTINFLFGDQ